MMKKSGVTSIRDDDPRDKEHVAIMNMLEFPNTLDYSMLDVLKPAEWKNVGPTVSHAVQILVA